MEELLGFLGANGTGAASWCSPTVAGQGRIQSMPESGSLGILVVLIICDKFMEKDAEGVTHWFPVTSLTDDNESEM